MSRKIWITSAVFVAAAVAAAAQNAPIDAPHEKLTVVGCVEPAQNTGSLAGTPFGTPATPNTAAVEANKGDLLFAFLLTDAAPAADASARAASSGAQESAAASPRGTRGEHTTYALEGHEQEVSNQTGHRVEITGTIVPPQPGRDDRPLASGVQHLRVETMKAISAECPKPEKK